MECILFDRVAGNAIVEHLHIELHSKQVMVISPGMIHSFEMECSPGGYVIVFQVSLKEIRKYLKLGHLFSSEELFFPAVSELYNPLSRILTDLCSKPPETIFGKIKAVLSVLEVLGPASGSFSEKRRLLPERIRESIKWTMEHFSQPIKLADAAGIACYTEEHFSRMFKKCTKSTWNDFLRSMRLDRAKVLLAGGMDVTSACYESGFGNLSYFIQVFRRYEGCTPKQFTESLLKGRESGS